MTRIVGLLFFLSFPIVGFCQNLMPANILVTDPKFSHHIFLVEKSTHTISVYQNNNGIPQLVKSYRIATGKFKGNKLSEGDHKTPEGIYQLQEFFTSTDLLKRFGNESKIYGAGAFTTNYPNPMDQKIGKSGSGIWLHSTDDDSRIEKGLDSRGCVVVVDKDLKDISQFIDLSNTSMIITHDQYFISEKAWSDVRNQILQAIEDWRNAWEEENIDQYMNFYHQEEFRDSKGNYNTYKAYKKNVFSNPGKPKIEFSHISVLHFNDYMIVQLEQKYVSNTINDSGKKTLYLKKNANYEWKIITENWSKLDKPGPQPFTPASRYFKN